jgi:hypothetical protein
VRSLGSGCADCWPEFLVPGGCRVPKLETLQWPRCSELAGPWWPLLAAGWLWNSCPLSVSPNRPPGPVKRKWYCRDMWTLLYENYHTPL